MLNATLVLGALTGCDVGEVPLNGGGTDGGGPTDANPAAIASFQSMVAPLVTECHSPGACHSIQIPILTSFETLAPRYTMKPGATNILVTKGAMEVVPGTHQGIPYLTELEQTTVANWIDSL